MQAWMVPSWSMKIINGCLYLQGFSSHIGTRWWKRDAPVYCLSGFLCNAWDDGVEVYPSIHHEAPPKHIIGCDSRRTPPIATTVAFRAHECFLATAFCSAETGFCRCASQRVSCCNFFQFCVMHQKIIKNHTFCFTLDGNSFDSIQKKRNEKKIQKKK